MPCNQALTFLKPHAARSPAVRQFVLDTFRGYGIDVLAERRMTGRQILADNLVDRHYAANARRGTFEHAMAVDLKDSAREAFRIAFDQTWEDAVREGKVFSGEAMRQRLGLNGEALNERWAHYGAHKLSAGCYAAWFEQEDCYVLNGFYPSVREQFTREDATLDIFAVGFELPWATFRSDVIGSTSPAAAVEGSIRGHLHDHAAEYGLLVDSRDNVIHASASPFEALCEGWIWLPTRQAPKDPLWKLLRHKTRLSAAPLRERLQDWHETNPLVRLPHREGSLLDLLEDHDTPEVAQDLLHLLNDAT